MMFDTDYRPSIANDSFYFPVSTSIVVSYLCVLGLWCLDDLPDDILLMSKNALRGVLTGDEYLFFKFIIRSRFIFGLWWAIDPVTEQVTLVIAIYLIGKVSAFEDEYVSDCHIHFSLLLVLY